MSNVPNQDHGDDTSNSCLEHAKEYLQAAARDAVRIVPIAAEYIPTDTKCGFSDSRKAGYDLIEHGIPYAAGAVCGFGYGAIEAVVVTLATPVTAIFGLGVGLGTWVGGMFCPAEAVAEGDNGIAAELPVVPVS